MEFYVTHEDHGPAWVTARDDAKIRLPAASYLQLTLNAEATVEIAHGHWQFFRVTSDGTFLCGPLPPNVPLRIHVYSPGHRPRFESVELPAGETQTMNIELSDGLSVWGTVTPRMEGVKIMAHQADANESAATTGPRPLGRSPRSRSPRESGCAPALAPWWESSVSTGPTGRSRTSR